MKRYNVAVVGATGAVGKKMIETLEKRNFPVNKLLPLASKRSAGTSVQFKGESLTVEELRSESFNGIDIALFSAGGHISELFAPEAVKHGAVVIDNTSQFRMDPNVPLVVPEVNPEDIFKHKGIIANPNCSTIQMVHALKPIYDAYGIRKIIVSTYQAVSGTGKEAIDELNGQSKKVLEDKPVSPSVYPHQIAFNLLPHIDVFLENGFTKEEMKMINETKKIMHDDSIDVTATCVRVPVVTGHSESIFVETEKDFDLAELVSEIERTPGLVVMNDGKNAHYPTPLYASNQEETFVGRIRRDLYNSRGLNLWVVSDNLLKGAALNSVQIAEVLIKS